jgi:hypothetical protein
MVREYGNRPVLWRLHISCRLGEQMVSCFHVYRTVKKKEFLQYVCCQHHLKILHCATNDLWTAVLFVMKPSTMKMEAICASETLVTTHKST